MGNLRHLFIYCFGSIFSFIFSISIIYWPIRGSILLSAVATVIGTTIVSVIASLICVFLSRWFS